jgi:hypothetical protein
VSGWIAFLREQIKRLVPGQSFKMQPPVYEAVCSWVQSAWGRVSMPTIKAGYKPTDISLDASDTIEHLAIDHEIGELS